MAGEIQALFNKYQQKYPLYTKEAIVDTMLKDGVITPDVAKKIKSGTSLFLLDNSFSSKNTSKDLNMTEIFGGSFSKQKAKAKAKAKAENRIPVPLSSAEIEIINSLV